MEVSRPKVSVIIPCYNVENYLRQCLDSVTNQTLKDIEIIIINNGASENEKQTISEFADNNKNIKIINFEENQGYGKAINYGLDIAEGEYIGIVESDDYIDSNMYSFLYESAKNNNADIVKSSFFSIKKDKIRNGVPKKLNIPKNKLLNMDERASLLSIHPSIWSCLYKKDFLKENNIRFIEIKGQNWVDNPFQVECFILAKNFVYVSDAFYYYRVNREGSSSCFSKNLEIPLTAVKMVQKVLDKYNVKNNSILSNLSFRHWGYIKNLVSKMEKDNLQEIQNYITEIFDIIGTNLDNNSKYKKYKKRFYNKNLKFQFFIEQQKKLFSNFIKNFILRRNK